MRTYLPPTPKEIADRERLLRALDAAIAHTEQALFRCRSDRSFELTSERLYRLIGERELEEYGLELAKKEMQR